MNTLNVGNATNEFWDAPHTQNAIDSAQYFKDNQWPEVPNILFFIIILLIFFVYLGTGECA